MITNRKKKQLCSWKSVTDYHCSKKIFKFTCVIATNKNSKIFCYYLICYIQIFMKHSKVSCHFRCSLATLWKIIADKTSTLKFNVCFKEYILCSVENVKRLNLYCAVKVFLSASLVETVVKQPSASRVLQVLYNMYRLVHHLQLS